MCKKERKREKWKNDGPTRDDQELMAIFHAVISASERYSRFCQRRKAAGCKSVIIARDVVTGKWQRYETRKERERAILQISIKQ